LDSPVVLFVICEPITVTTVKMIALTFLSNTPLPNEEKTAVVKGTTRFSGNKNQLRF
jgi:hypothetical protein